MNEKEILKKLKTLKSVKPNSAWLSRNRDLLMTVLSEDVRQEDAEKKSNFSKQRESESIFSTFRSTLALLLPQNRTLLMLKPAGAFLTLSIVLLTSGIFTVSAAQDTLPGDALYSVKIVSEKVQQALATSDQEKAKLDITFAGKRIKEFEQIIVTTEEEGEKTRKVDAVLTKFEENVISAQTKLAHISQTENHQEASYLAKDIDEKVTSYKETLEKNADLVENQLTDEGNKQEVKNKVKKATDLAGETTDASLKVILEKHESGDALISNEELSGKIDLRLTDVNKLLAHVNNELLSLTSSTIATSTDEMFTQQGSNEETTSTATTTDTMVEIFEKKEVAEALLLEAQALRDEAELSHALSKIHEAKALLMILLEQLANYKKVEESINDSTDENGNVLDESDQIAETATSTEIEHKQEESDVTDVKDDTETPAEASEEVVTEEAEESPQTS